MRYIIMCDEKPQKCDECLFMRECFEKTDKPNHFNITNKCSLGANDISECPMTVINTVFADDV